MNIVRRLVAATTTSLVVLVLASPGTAHVGLADPFGSGSVTSPMRAGTAGDDVGDAWLHREASSEGETLRVHLHLDGGMTKSTVCLSATPFTAHQAGPSCPSHQGLKGATQDAHAIAVPADLVGQPLFAQVYAVTKGGPNAYAGWVNPAQGAVFGNLAVPALPAAEPAPELPTPPAAEPPVIEPPTPPAAPPVEQPPVEPPAAEPPVIEPPAAQPPPAAGPAPIEQPSTTDEAPAPAVEPPSTTDEPPAATAPVEEAATDPAPAAPAEPTPAASPVVETAPAPAATVDPVQLPAAPVTATVAPAPTAPVRVLGVQTSRQEALARTGSPLGQLLAAAAGLLVLGQGLVGWARRRPA